MANSDLDPTRLVFIDETWTATNMTRSHGRCRRGERLRMGYPHGHRKTTTLVAGLRMTGMVARWCSTPDQRRLVRSPCPAGPRARSRMRRRRHHGQLSSHKRASVREAIEAAGARLMFLPPYSPDFKPIEKAFARLKAMLRRAGERTVSGLWSLIGKLVDCFSRRNAPTTSSLRL